VYVVYAKIVKYGLVTFFCVGKVNGLLWKEGMEGKDGWEEGRKGGKVTKKGVAYCQLYYCFFVCIPPGI
jgi:hypothetical protein